MTVWMASMIACSLRAMGSLSRMIVKGAESIAKPAVSGLWAFEPGQRLQGVRDQLFQRRHVHIGQALQVEAALARLVPAQPGQQFGLGVEAGHQIERQVVLARREADARPADGLATAGRHLVAAEADDGRPPHDGRRAGGRAHQLSQHLAVGAALGIGLGRAEIVDRGFGGTGLWFGPGPDSTICQLQNSQGFYVSDRLAVLPQYLMPKQAMTLLAGQIASARMGGLTTAIIRRFVAR